MIGFGLAGSSFHAPVIAAVPGLQLAAVASSQEKLVHSSWPTVRVVSEARQLIEDDSLDLIVIAAPNAVHFELAQAALLAGKHVVVDKPFTVHSSEALELIACANKVNKLLSVYHNRRWDGDFLTLQQLLQEKRLGRITSLESRIDRFRPQVRERWREQAVPGAGLLYDLGPHLIDQALCLFGMPQHIYADLALQRDNAQVVDYLHLVLYYTIDDEEIRVVLHAGSLTAAPTPRFALHGDVGSFTKFGMDPQEDALRAGGKPGSPHWGVSAKAGTLHMGGLSELNYPIL
ncbi:MAG: oxidoreductase, partial [Burkholderiales bacterium]|nr:oxidoreductase [Burkholderiales bacterium]